MKIFISLSAVNNAGPIVVTTDVDGSSWKAVWLNKMTNALTQITRVGKDDYVIENTTPRTPSVKYRYSSLKEACLTFLINADTERLAEDIISKARKIVCDFVKKVEKLSVLNFTLKDSERSKKRKGINKSVLIGKHQEQRGIMLGMDWSATKAKVAILNELGVPQRIVEIPTTHVWLV